MADVTPAPAVAEFNVKVAELIKASKADDIIEVLRNDSSLMVKHQTQNNNMRSAE